MASRLLLAARNASVASRAAAAAASRAAAMASHSARASRAAAAMASGSARAAAASRAAAMASRSAGVAAASRAAAMASRSRAARLGSHITAALDLDSCCQSQTKHRDDAPRFDPVEYCVRAKYLPDDVLFPTDKDIESDEATWALYERWWKVHNKDRDHADMMTRQRFKIFKYYAMDVHHWNTHLPPDPKKAAIYIRKRQKVKLLISKGQDVSHFDECYRPMLLGPFADGGDPLLTEDDKRMLKAMEERDAVQDVTASSFA